MARRIGLRRPRHSHSGTGENKSPTVYLLPNYDEHISYKDRSAVFDMQYADKMMDPPANDAFFHYLVVDGQIVGTGGARLAKARWSLNPNRSSH